MKKPIITVVYSHGKGGSPWYGSKIEILRPIILQAEMNVVSVRYDETLTLPQMEQHLVQTLKDETTIPGDVILIGSSRGAYITIQVAKKIKDYYALQIPRMENSIEIPPRNVLGQFFIAPAIYINPESYPDQNPLPADIPTVLIHGINDELIDYKKIVSFANTYNLPLHLLQGDHRLNEQIPEIAHLLQMFLQQCRANAQQVFDKWNQNNTLKS